MLELARTYADIRHEQGCRNARCDGRCSAWGVPAQYETGHLTPQLVDGLTKLPERRARMVAKQRLHDAICRSQCSDARHRDLFRPQALALVTALSRHA